MRRLAALSAVALVLALTGCSAIPITGPVNTSAPQGVSQPGALVLTPGKPTPGAQRADIVQGFLNAATGQQDDYAIARDYLTPTFAKRWKPNAGVLVSQGRPVVSTDGSSASVPVTATVNAAGTYTESTSGTPTGLTFRLEKVSGDWRIASAPDGIVLPLDYFQRLFQAVPLDYYTPDFGELVPDLRWFAARSDTPSQVVRRLIAGAAGPVASPVTASAFPDGTRLVRLSGTGTSMLVDLHFGAGTPTVAVLERIRRQLEETLMGLGVQRVEVAVDGVVVAGLADARLSPSTSGTGAPLVLRGSTFGYLSGGNFAADKALGTAIAKAKPRAVTVSIPLGVAAVLTSGRDVALVTPSRSTTIDKGRGPLIAPTVDPQGWVWSVPAADPGGLRATKDGRSVSLALGLDADDVTTIEVSPDGTRLLVVLDGTTDPQVVVAGVVRSDDGSPNSLTDAVYESPVTDPEVLDATWADSGSIALLTRHADGTDGVVLQQLGGLASRDGTLRNATAIVGGATQSDLAVLSGRDLQQTSEGSPIWQSIATGIDLVAVQR